MGEKLGTADSKDRHNQRISPMCHRRHNKMPVSRVKLKRHDHGCNTGVKHTVALHNTFWHPS